MNNNNIYEMIRLTYLHIRQTYGWHRTAREMERGEFAGLIFLQNETVLIFQQA